MHGHNTVTQPAQYHLGPWTGHGRLLKSHLDELNNLDVVGGGRDACLKQQGPDDTCKAAMPSAKSGQHMSARVYNTWTDFPVIVNAVIQQQHTVDTCTDKTLTARS